MEHRNMTNRSEKVAANVTPEEKERIKEQLEYGDSISDWVRDAVLEKLENAEQGCDSGKPTGAGTAAD